MNEFKWSRDYSRSIGTDVRCVLLLVALHPLLVVAHPLLTVVHPLLTVVHPSSQWSTPSP